MLIYWFLFAFFAVGALATSGQEPELRRRSGLVFAAGMLLIALAIGLRYRVGADWENYIGIFADTAGKSLKRMLSIGDPSYQLLNWGAHQVGGDIWVVNTICGLVFSWGLYRFCKVQPSPWLAAAVAVPYLVIVVGMGYSRQAVALGILLAGLAQVIRGASVVRFVPYVALAGGFHATAVIVFPLVSLATKRSRFLNIMLVIFASYFLYDAFLGSSMDKYMYIYVSLRYSSQGALIRIGMNAIAAAIFFLAGRRLAFEPHEAGIWRLFSMAAIGMLLFYFVFPSSTALDRLALYVLPLQIAVFTRLAFAGNSASAGTVGVLAYFASVQFVWLNFAQHARFWVPYQLFPLF